MKWLGNSEKQVFLTWVHNAKREELVTYLEEREEKWHKYKYWFALFLYVIFICAIMFGVGFYIINNQHNNYVSDMTEVHTSVGKYLCDDYVDYYRDVETNSLIFHCKYGNILIRGDTNDMLP